jgi:hypothetical protein
VRFRYLSISPRTAEKIIRKHALTPAEAREAFEGGSVFRGPRSRQGGYTYVVRGRTYAGRPLWLLVSPAGEDVATLITARDDK